MQLATLIMVSFLTAWILAREILALRIHILQKRAAEKYAQEVVAAFRAAQGAIPTKEMLS